MITITSKFDGIPVENYMKEYCESLVNLALYERIRVVGFENPTELREFAINMLNPNKIRTHQYKFDIDEADLTYTIVRLK
jgi:hypothetical protein